MTQIVRKRFDACIKSVDAAAKTVTALVSTSALDRDDERILPQAFEPDLAEFLRNAVHLWGHNAFELRNVLGRAVDAQVTPEGLVVTFEYAVDANPDAAIAFNLIQCGALSAYSVGFIPVDWVIPSEKTMPEYIGARRVYTRVRLVEISLVAIPSNPEALVVGRQMDAESEGASKTMDHQLTDAAARLQAAAEALGASPDAEGIEAIAQVCTAVAADLLQYAAGQEANEMHEDSEPADEAAAEGDKSADGLVFKSGAVLSAANKKRLTKIYKMCKSAMSHCKEMAAEAEHDPEADDEDEKADAGGRDNGGGTGATNHQPSDAEQNAGKSAEAIDIATLWERMKNQS